MLCSSLEVQILLHFRVALVILISVWAPDEMHAQSPWESFPEFVWIAVPGPRRTAARLAYWNGTVCSCIQVCKSCFDYPQLPQVCGLKVADFGDASGVGDSACNCLHGMPWSWKSALLLSKDGQRHLAAGASGLHQKVDIC